jgi:hypothetical protein
MEMDRWFSIGGVAGTLLFGVLSIYFYFRPRNLRRLDAIWAISLLQTRRHPRVKIYFDDKEVETISRVRLLFLNSGTNDIRKSDLGGSSKVEVQTEGAEVLSVACIGGAAEETNATLSTLSRDGADVVRAFENTLESVFVMITLLAVALAAQGEQGLSTIRMILLGVAIVTTFWLLRRLLRRRRQATYGLLDDE